MQELEQLLHDYVRLVWTEKNPSAVYQFLTPGYQRYRSPHQPPLDREGQVQLIAAFQSAFPDAELSIEEVIVADGRLAFRSTLRATHQGDFMGLPASGNAIMVSLLDLIHVQDNKFVRQWGGPDLLDLVRQIGGKMVAE